MSEFSRLTRDERALADIIGGFLFGRPVPAESAELAASHGERLIHVAERQQLAPLLYLALKESSAASAAAPELLDRLRLDLAQSAAAGLIASAELDRVLAAFSQQHIPVVVLKGAALARSLYSDPALRSIGDLDLLIPEQCIGKARELMFAQGYASSPAIPDEPELRAFEESFFRSGKTPAQLDLHWHLLESGYFRSRTPIEWFWQHTEAVKLDGRAALTLGPAAHLLYLSAHNVLQHRGQGLKWSLDAALLVDRRREQIDWDELLSVASRFGLTLPLRAAADMALEVWGISLPERAKGRLEEMRTSRTERIVYAVTTAPMSELRFVLNGLSAPGIGNKAVVLTRLAFPQPAFMRERYHIRHARLLPLYYGLRVGQSCVKILRSGVSALVNRDNG